MQKQLMARGRRAYIQTRMEHKFVQHVNPVGPIPAFVVHTFQLEGGDEECQVKRLILSMATGGVNCVIKWGLFQEAPATETDFTDETLFAAFAGSSQQLIDRSTTMRVPRGWHIGILVMNKDTTSAAARGIVDCTVLHYKVLS